MRIIVLFFLLLISNLPQAAGQSVEALCIPFEITFWQKELRLTKAQRLEVYLINRELYRSIREMSLAPRVDTEDLQTVLELWKHLTIAVLTPTQKKKWRKLINKYYGDKDKNNMGPTGCYDY